MGGCSDKPGYSEWKKDNKGGPYWYMKDVYFDSPTNATLKYREER